MRIPRLILAGSIFLLAALVAARLVSSRLSDDPVEYTVALSSAPWTAALDPQTGRLFVVNRALAGAGSAGRYAFSSAGSYGFAVNGAAVGTRIGTAAAPSPDSVSLLEPGSRLIGFAVPVAADPGAAAVDPRDGMLYVTSEDENLVDVLDDRLHTMRSLSVGTRPTALVVSSATRRIFAVNAGDGTITTLDSRTGKVLRTVQASAAGDFAGLAVDTARARVYVAGQGSASVLDARSGALLNTFALEPPGQASAASAVYSGDATATVLADQNASRLYVLESGTLFTVDTNTYRVVHRVFLGPGVTVAAFDGQDDRILLAGGSPAARLQVLDAQSGAILRAVSLHVAPVALEVDERNNRLLVVGRSAAQAAADPWHGLPAGLRRLLPFASARGSSDQGAEGSVVVLDLKDLAHP
jgi:DNA-binding beta-propeller fold protein YncE